MACKQFFEEVNRKTTKTSNQTQQNSLGRFYYAERFAFIVYHNKKIVKEKNIFYAIALAFFVRAYVYKGLYNNSDMPNHLINKSTRFI